MFFGNVAGVVAGALEIGQRLEDGGQKAQVASHRLMAGDRRQYLVLDGQLHRVHLFVQFDGRSSLGHVLFHQTGAGQLQLLAHQAYHLQEVLGNLGQVPLQRFTHLSPPPLLPVA